ncbi:MAG: glycosyltransferase family 2 protein, partial [Opitutaceae bacterium]
PGMLLLLGGATLGAMALAGVQVGRATLDVHTLLVASLLIIIGAQGIYLSIFAHTFAVAEGLQPASALIARFYRVFNLEKALVIAAVTGGLGGVLIAKVWWEWRGADYGPLAYTQSLRWVIPGVTLVALSAQAMFSSFMVSLLGLERK